MRRAVVAAGIAVAVAGCGSSSSGGGAQVQPTSPSPTVSSPSRAGATVAKGCTFPTEPRAKPQTFGAEPKLTTAPVNYTATIVTNCGTIVVTLDGKNAPHTVNSFAFLASKGYFNDTNCHRLTTAQAGISDISVLQCGDPLGNGTGGPGYTIPDENLKGATYPPGTLAMANTGQPHTGGSQFFFVYGPTKLEPHYTPFGHVTSGMDVLKRIAAAGSTPPFDGTPNQLVVIESFTVKKG